MVTKNRLQNKVRPVARQLEGIAHVSRLAIVYLLAGNDLDPRELVDYLGLPQTLVAHHLRRLLVTGWVTKTRVGRRVTYRLNEKAFSELSHLLADTPFGKNVLSKAR